MMHEGQVEGVLDIDSDRLGDFDEDDRCGLEAVVSALMRTLFNK